MSSYGLLGNLKHFKTNNNIWLIYNIINYMNKIERLYQIRNFLSSVIALSLNILKLLSIAFYTPFYNFNIDLS